MEVKTYSVKFKVSARKKLDKLDAPIRQRIISWIERNLVGCENPRVNVDCRNAIKIDS